MYVKVFKWPRSQQVLYKHYCRYHRLNQKQDPWSDEYEGPKDVDRMFEISTVVESL